MIAEELNQAISVDETSIAMFTEKFDRLTQVAFVSNLKNLPSMQGSEITLANNEPVTRIMRDKKPIVLSVGERGSDLRARLRAGRKFQMPAGIRPAGAAAQRDPTGGQIVPGGVEVHRFQGLRRHPVGAADRRETFDGNSVLRGQDPDR